MHHLSIIMKGLAYLVIHFNQMIKVNDCLSILSVSGPGKIPALSQIKPHAPRSCGALPSIPSSFTLACILPRGESQTFRSKRA